MKVSNKERMDFIRDYFEKEGLVEVEIPPRIVKSGNQTTIYRFSGDRMNYTFIEGKSKIKRVDLSKLINWYPDLIIHNRKEAE
jgi:hypothetical protein